MLTWCGRVTVVAIVWAATACGQKSDAAELQAKGKSSMSETTNLGDLFDRWERVWHEGQYDLILGCVGPTYIRHDEAGDRTVTRDAYAAEIARTREQRPHLRFVVYDHSFVGNRAWFRFTLKWTEGNTGETRTRAGMQVYRIENGKLAETWLEFQPLGSAWTDAAAQEHWTSPPPIR
jgi:SnoaL-like domain